MNKNRFWIFLICALIFPFSSLFAKEMLGKIYDRETGQPLAGVNVINIHTDMLFQTDSTGAFRLNVEEGQMIEFKKMGFQIARVRISGGALPFYSIGLRKGAIEIPEVNIKGHNFTSDSIENREIYNWAIEHYTLEGYEIIQHPFDALSKRNRQIWAFQKHFQYFEQQKFVDFVFNDKLIQNITNLEGDELVDYKIKYRPSYEEIQLWTTYEFLDYIKKSGAEYKRLFPKK